MPSIDQRDLDILAARSAALDAVSGPRVGDWVEFTDGVSRRISHLWPESAQTSDGGSFYLGDGYVSMSGALHDSVPTDSLVITGERRAGAVWFFHHDHATAHNGVETTLLFRVYTCNLPAPR